TTIGIGNQEGARRMTEHLLSLGHERIAFVAGPLNLTAANDRLAGYREALAAAGLLANELVVAGDFTREAGMRAASYLLETHVSTRAFFAANDKMALGCLAGIRDAGMSVPATVSVVGFGDIPAASDSDPPLTTVTIPLREVGRLAMQQIFRQVSGEPITP